MGIRPIAPQAIDDSELAVRIERHYARNGSRGTYLSSRALDTQLTAAAYRLLDRVRLTIGLGRAPRPPFLPRAALSAGKETARAVQARLNGQPANGKVRSRRRERAYHLGRSDQSAS